MCEWQKTPLKKVKGPIDWKNYELISGSQELIFLLYKGKENNFLQSNNQQTNGHGIINRKYTQGKMQRADKQMKTGSDLTSSAGEHKLKGK